MFAWEWLYIPQSWNGAELVNPGTLCDGGVLRAQHSPPRGRLLFFPVMSILLGISASLHTTCWAQQCGVARESGVVVSTCQSQSQGSVSSHQSEKLVPRRYLSPTPSSSAFRGWNSTWKSYQWNFIEFHFNLACYSGVTWQVHDLICICVTNKNVSLLYVYVQNKATLSLHHLSFLFASSIIC